MFSLCSMCFCLLVRVIIRLFCYLQVLLCMRDKVCELVGLSHTHQRGHTPSAADSLRPRDGTQCIGAARLVHSDRRFYQIYFFLFDRITLYICSYV